MIMNMKSLRFLFTAVAVALIALLPGCKSLNKTEDGGKSEAQEKGVYFLPQGAIYDVNENPEKLTIIDFNATWCGPCKAFSPIFEEAAKDYAGKVKFIAVDVDLHREMAEELNINSIPAILFINTNGVKEWSVGLMTKEDFYGTIDSALK